MTDSIKLTYHTPCRCHRTLFKYEKTLRYIKDGQITTVKPYRHWNECIKKTKLDDEKLNCEWLYYRWSHL